MMTDLSSILQTGVCVGNPQSIINHLRIMQATRDQDGIALLNKETEEFFQITTPLSGMMELTEQQLHTMSFAARVPVTKLFLTPPKGFSSTDEMSEQNWAQVINGRQTRQLTDNVVKAHKIIALSEWGRDLGTLDYEWPDVRDMSAKEKAELQNQLAQRDSTLVGSQILDASEVRERMAADDESGYSGIYIGDDWEPENAPPEPWESEEEEGAVGSEGGRQPAQQEQAAPKPQPGTKKKEAGQDRRPFGDAEWEEGKHPRAANGQFGSGGGSSSSQKGLKRSVTNQENGKYKGKDYNLNGKKVGVGTVAQAIFDKAAEALEKQGMPVNTTTIIGAVGQQAFEKIKSDKFSRKDQMDALVQAYNIKDIDASEKNEEPVKKDLEQKKEK